LLRQLFLKASESEWLRERAPKYRFVRHTVERFLPGESVEDALRAARRLSEQGVHSLLTHLGENVTERAEAEATTAAYLSLLDQIQQTALPAEISVKLTQLGLDLDADFCFANLSRLFSHPLHAQPGGRVVWIDMEHSPYVDVTLEIYRRARKADARVGIALQAYLYRTEQDLRSLLPLGGAVRLVKGAYSEPSEIAYPLKRDVDDSYFRLAQILLSEEARQHNVRGAMATHDLHLISRIQDAADASHIPKEEVEFAMLYGIQREAQVQLAKEGYRSCVLVSYGKFWFPWFMRRLAERPANVFFLLRNLF
jgi:proline dehydrogenase